MLAEVEKESTGVKILHMQNYSTNEGSQTIKI